MRPRDCEVTDTYLTVDTSYVLLLLKSDFSALKIFRKGVRWHPKIRLFLRNLRKATSAQLYRKVDQFQKLLLRNIKLRKPDEDP